MSDDGSQPPEEAQEAEQAEFHPGYSSPHFASPHFTSPESTIHDYTPPDYVVPPFHGPDSETEAEFLAESEPVAQEAGADGPHFTSPHFTSPHFTGPGAMRHGPAHTPRPAGSPPAGQDGTAEQDAPGE